MICLTSNILIRKSLSMHKTSSNSIDAVTYHGKYITMKTLNHLNINCQESLYLVFNNVN